MPGAASKARRKAAVEKAKKDVYRLKGDLSPRVIPGLGLQPALCINPFDDERQDRIYWKYVEHYEQHYKQMEWMMKDLEEAYGSFSR